MTSMLAPRPGALPAIWTGGGADWWPRACIRCCP